VTVHGRPTAVLVAPEDLESLEETIEILADADAMRRLRAGEENPPQPSYAALSRVTRQPSPWSSVMSRSR
jgi:antitoxin Phd_YefM of type II toxin-antitoxin system